MASLLSSILRAVNRKNNKVNILTIHNSESFEYMLAKTGQNIFILFPENAKKWQENIRPIPNNCFILFGKTIQEQLKQDIQFDIILCQNRQRDFQLLWTISQQTSCPIIMAENNLSTPDANPFQTESLANQPYNAQIFNSEFLANSWGFDIEDNNIFSIPYGIDTKLFDGYIGGDGKILTIVNDYINKNSLMGFDLYQQITNGLQVNPIGNTNKFSKPTNNFMDLINKYKKCSVFLNTSSWISCPMALLEAMSVGCPVVSTATTIIPDIITNGINGFISHDPQELRNHIIRLAQNPEEGKKIGQNARKTILEKFNQNDFIIKWNNVFKEYIGKTSSSFTFEL